MITTVGLISMMLGWALFLIGLRLKPGRHGPSPRRYFWIQTAVLWIGASALDGISGLMRLVVLVGALALGGWIFSRCRLRARSVGRADDGLRGYSFVSFLRRQWGLPIEQLRRDPRL